MRIHNRTSFLALPAGTVYAEYRPNAMPACGPIHVKSSSPGEYTNDFVYYYLEPEGDDDSITDIMDEAEALASQAKIARKEGVSPERKLTFELTVRDGVYREDQLFLVFTKEEIENLISVLRLGLTN